MSTGTAGHDQQLAEGVVPFTLAIDQAALDDLATRLAMTRWPEKEPVTDQSQGVPLAYLRELCDYWATSYDWRRCEKRLNDFGQFQTTIDGVDIHFIHVRSPHPGAMPLILTHGWPGSVVEMLDVIGPLVDPVAHGGSAEDAFDVVVPSLPGYGFSSKPTETGWDIGRIARAWAVLMDRLGYPSYAAQGGDWGSMVTTRLGDEDPEHVLGIHLNMPLVFADPETEPTADEQEMIAALNTYMNDGSGYMKEQSTRPQTIGYSLVDSPVGQAAWVVEKFWEWTDNRGDLASVLTMDQILDGVMLYWLPATGASSARLYWEALKAMTFPVLTVPVGITVFPKEIYRTSKRWAEKAFPTLTYFSERDRGGHFAAFEQPEIFVEEMRACFRPLR
jgi:epoxide hydrolase